MSIQEEEPYERIATRVAGLRRISTLATIAADTKTELSPAFWSGMLYFIGQIADDIEADARAMHFSQECKPD